ncbi:MAG: hypothetical protein ACOYOT_00920 [Bacteroidales bacterium]
MKKIKNWIIILFLLISVTGQTQIMCLNDSVLPVSTRSANSANCSFNDVSIDNIENVLFEPSANSEIIYVKLNLHIMQKSDGSNNFQDNSTHRAYILSIIQGLNEIYSNIQQPRWNGLKNDPYIIDSKIRFVVDGLFFHKDDVANIEYPYEYCYNTYAVNTNSSINVFFCELQNYHYLAGRGQGLLGENSNYARLFSHYYDYINNPNHTPAIDAELIAHELGHCLGLFHTRQPDELSDTYYPDQNYFCDCLSVANCSNNLMSASNSNRYISPMQMGKMRRLLTVGWRSKLQDQCNENLVNVSISSAAIWDQSRSFHSGIDLLSGSSITSLCKVYLPSSKSISIGQGAQFVIEGGEVTNQCGQKVNISVLNGGCLTINNAMFDNCQITVNSGGTLIIVGNLQIVNQGLITVKTNGYLCISSNAVLQLNNSSNNIVIENGALFGVNTAYVTSQNNCSSDMNSISVTGAGHILSYNTDLYISNLTISSNKYYSGRNIYVAGSGGTVLINNNASVTFDAAQDVVFQNGFEVSLGASYEVLKH